MTFKNNLSFAILPGETSWRSDLTERYCEWYSYQFNDAFQDYVYGCTSIDDALAKCKTDYVIIQNRGNLIVDATFFELLQIQLAKEEDIFLTDFNIAEDYLTLGKSCVVVNRKLWIEKGSPKFNRVTQHIGLPFEVSIPNLQHNPFQVTVAEGDKVIVPDTSCMNGGLAFVAQLEAFGKVNSLSLATSSTQHYLDTKTPFMEIMSETDFEKRRANRHKVHLVFNETDMGHGFNADIVVAPARGLKAYRLASKYGAANIQIYAPDAASLQFQQLILSTKKPTPYSEIVREFTKGETQFKSLELVYGTETNVQTVRLDMLSCEGVEFIDSLPKDGSLVIDFDDTFVNPSNMYHRPLYQVEALFAQMYAKLRARTGPTYILGYAPQFQKMDAISVNTSNEKYELKKHPNRSLNMFEPKRSDRFDEVLPQKPSLISKIVGAVRGVNALEFALQNGYTKTSNQDFVFLTKSEYINGICFNYFYEVNEATSKWTFKVSLPQDGRMIELDSNDSLNSMKEHMMSEVKFNPDTVLKFFE
jgi:hypothetical protein